MEWKPSQVQLHHDGGYHLKMMLDDSVQSFALGRTAIEKIIECKEKDQTGGPMGTFDKIAWDCGTRKDCCVIANGKYQFEPSTKDGAKFGEGKYTVQFESGDGFSGGSLSFTSRFIKGIGPRWKGLYAINPISCSNVDAKQILKNCPGTSTSRQSRLL